MGDSDNAPLSSHAAADWGSGVETWTLSDTQLVEREGETDAEEDSFGSELMDGLRSGTYATVRCVTPQAARYYSR